MSELDKGDRPVEAVGECLGVVDATDLRAPASSAADSSMYRSVGKLSRSVTITRRPARSRIAATATLNRLTEVESPTRTSSGRAPTRGAIRAPRVAGLSHQPAASQLRTSPSPHSVRRVASTRATEVRGGGPSELPPK